MQATLRLNVTGERIRSLLALRLKEFDRCISRVEAALEAARAEQNRVVDDIDDRVRAVRDRAQRMAPLGRRDEGSQSIGIGEYAGYQAQVDQYNNAVETLRYQKAQVVWMTESFDPSKAYELDANDLMILGLSVHSMGSRGVFDPLDL